MTTQVQLRSRPFRGEQDIQPLCDLYNECDAVDKFDDNYSVEQLHVEFQAPTFDPKRDIRIWEDEEGRVLAAGRLWVVPAEEWVDGFLHRRVHPTARDTGVEDEIMAWAEERAREAGREQNKPPKLRSSVRDFDKYGREVLERHGLEAVRYFFKMERDLSEPIPEPRFPEGYTLRHVENDADLQLWVDCFNLSFIDHYNFHPTTVELQKHWRSDPAYVAEQDLIATAPDGTVAAFCFCFIDPSNNERNNRLEGWIDVLGTRRGHRKIGLGKAMLLSGMLAIKEAGMEKSVLGVDAENPTGALGLYESVGFRQVQTMVGYCKDL